MDIKKKELLGETACPEVKEELLSLLLQNEGFDVFQASTITPRGKGQNPCLSFAQQRLWFLDQLEPDNSAYNIPVVIRLSGVLTVGVLEKCLNEIVRRHESLRSTFAAVEGRPIHITAPELTLTLPVIRLKDLPANKREAEAHRLAVEQAQEPFDLARGSLVRVSLLRLDDEDHWLLATIHHIVSDGWSLGIFRQELATLYKAISGDKPSPLPELPIQYADFAHWQCKWLQGEVLESQLAYWKQQLEGAPPLLELPTDHPRPAAQTYRGARQSLVLPKGLSEALKALSLRGGVTLFMTLLAAFQTLLHRYTGQDNIVVGSPIAGRNRSELEGLIGFFVNTLVLCTGLSGNPAFRELLGRVREVALGAYAHQDLPFEKLVEELQPERDLSRTPLFQVMFDLQDVSVQTLELPGLTASRIPVEKGTAPFDLTLSVFTQDKGLTATMEYNTDLFGVVTIERMLGHFQVLLEGIVADPEQRISELPLLTEGERHQLLVQWNATEADYPKDVCLHQLFEAQVERTPDAVAVEFEDKRLTYRELNTRANQLAHHLQSLGVGPEVLVGIFMDRSLEMVIGLHGILKAGGAYVPLDPGYPQERLAFMLEDAQVPVLLTQSQLMEGLPEHEAQGLCLDANCPEIARAREQNLASGATAMDLAYVIYTSGSMGKPKGVEIPHRALTNFLRSMCREPGIAARDVLLAVTTLSFDIAGLELYLPLLVGAKVVLASREVASDGERLATQLETSGATVMQATPATWRLLVESGWSGQAGLRILCGGETLTRELADELLKRGASLWNMYGPTEATIWSTVHRVQPGKGPVVVGRPIANTAIYVLDEQLQPVPIGVPGEVYIGGEGLARGYWKCAALTAERFVAAPFPEALGARLYRTGDLGRYRAEGTLEVLGRVDFQVKVRGFRIELGEIEAVLEQHPGVGQAVVVTREDAGDDKRLVAYVVAAGKRGPSAGELRGHLKEQLPEYMVPAAYEELEAFPLTPNGKVDRKLLPKPEQSAVSIDNERTAPRDELEAKLIEVWEEVLEVTSVRVHDDFFDLGGHSLMAVRLFSRIEDAIGVRLPLATLFQAGTVESLAKIIRPMDQSTETTCLVPIRGEGSRPPLFLIHAEGGEVIFYREFAYLVGGDQPVYGLQARGLDGQNPPHRTFEEMGAHYIELIQTVQPNGPYFIGGHCFGGVIAFEMAQQLYAQGEEVALLAMLAGSAPRFNRSPRDQIRYAIKALLKDPISLLSYLVLTEIPTQVRWQGSKLMELFSRNNGEEISDSVSVHLEKVGTALQNAYLEYIPNVYPGRITYFMSAERARLPHEKWSELAAGGFELYVFPGTPNTTFSEPSLPVLAEQMRNCLQESQVKSSKNSMQRSAVLAS